MTSSRDSGVLIPGGCNVTHLHISEHYSVTIRQRYIRQHRESILPELRGEGWLCLWASEDEARKKKILTKVICELKTNRCMVCHMRGDDWGERACMTIQSFAHPSIHSINTS